MNFSAILATFFIHDLPSFFLFFSGFFHYSIFRCVAPPWQFIGFAGGVFFDVVCVFHSGIFCH